MGRNNRILFMLVAAILYILLFYTSLMKKSNTDSGDDETYEDSTQQATANGQGFNFFGNFFKKQGLEDEKKAKQIFVESFNTPRKLGSIKERGLKKPLVLSYTQYYDHTDWPGLELCPQRCDYTTDNSLYEKADLVLFQGWKSCSLSASAANGIKCVGWDEPNEIWDMPARNIRDQVWLFQSHESQQNIASGERLKFADGLFNYTVTYKEDSTYSNPYGETLKYHETGTDTYSEYTADKKSHLILWLVSHCDVPLRDNYAQKLRDHIHIDEFGKCSGNRDECGQYNYQCNKKMKLSYKFYLAFENTICDQYITEKLWSTYTSGMVPIVLGTSMSYYKKVSPPNSFIHVDNFTSPEALAEYIHYLDKNDEAYNKYHEWRKTHKAQIAWVRHACEICRLASEKPQSTIELSTWWNMDTQCSNFSYNKFDLTQDVLESVQRPSIQLDLT